MGNRMTLQTFKARLLGAKKGFNLLKKKRDALKARFQALLQEICEVKISVGVGLKDAAFSMAKANWAMAGDDIPSTVVERAKRPSVVCKMFADNVAGVQIPSFKMTHDATKDPSLSSLGIAHGGAVIQNCRDQYVKAVQQLVRLASLQTAFKTLDEEIKMTSRRVNALEYVLQEIDEESRDEFCRVKKVVEKKKAKILKEAAELEKEQGQSRSAIDAPSMFDNKKDDDIVF